MEAPLPFKFPYPVAMLALLVIAALAVSFFLVGPPKNKSSITFVSNEISASSVSSSESSIADTIVINISGAVASPGVYQLPSSSRINDAVQAAGSFSAQVDWAWVNKSLNLAAKIKDGDKLYIPFAGESPQDTAMSAGEVSGVSSSTSGLININTASLEQLDLLPGIGPARAQAIIDNRPYQNLQSLLDRKVVSKSVYENIKEKIGV